MTVSSFAHAGMMGNGMGDMMRSSSSATSPSKDASSATDNGYRLMQKFCVQCHQLPRRIQHKAEEWPSVVTRMIGHMHQRGLRFPDKHDEQSIIEYLSQK